MPDIRRILVIFVIAVLFTILVNVSIEAFYPEPQYDDYCEPNYPRPLPYKEPPRTCDEFGIPQNLADSCSAQDGELQYKYDEYSCVSDVYCDFCNTKLQQDQQQYNLVVFIVSAIAGLAALILGFYLPQAKNVINEWVGSGFLLGGMLSIFVGTVRYFGDMGRYTRPVVILIELIIVIFLAYKKLGKKR